MSSVARRDAPHLARARSARVAAHDVTRGLHPIAVMAVERRRRREPAAPRRALWAAVSRDLENLSLEEPRRDLELRRSAYVYLFPEYAAQLATAAARSASQS